MSRRSNAPRRVTTDKLETFDQRTKANMVALLEAYHEKHVGPVKAWAALPWYRRLFTKP